jgi:hypothetical protein
VTDSTTDAPGQDPNADAGQDPNTNATGANEQDSQPTGFDALPPETQKEIRALRKEAAGYRKKVEDYENATKTEQERKDAALKAAEDRAAAAEGKARELISRSAVMDAATAAKAISAKAVYALIKGDLEFNDAGEPTNIDALLKQAQKDDPELFKAANGSGDGGKGSPVGQTLDMNAALRAMARGGT